MIKLVVGLGNPGRQYEKTRHNAGFLFLDALASELNCHWTDDAGFQGARTECSLAGQKVLLFKPDTYMNRSGLAVGKIVRYYKFTADEILVVHDELDIAAGKVRLKKDGGHAGHNGLRDIIAHLGSREFYRLRIGIGRPDEGKSVADFVLSQPSGKEWELIKMSIDSVMALFEQIVIGEVAAVMNKLNV